MVELVMLVGLPASGKSTYAKQLEKEGYKRHSSDDIRKELNVGQEANDKVFNTLNMRVLDDLKSGFNCVYDATNLNRKKRKNFLNNFKNDTNVYKKCVLFVASLKYLKECNNQREGVAKVPDEVYERMIRNFEVPYYTEGFDDIQIIYSREGAEDYDINPYSYMDYQQDTPYHCESLGIHEISAADHFIGRGQADLYVAALYHDCGKPYVKEFKNSQAHYYNHENVGAYFFLVSAYLSYKDKQELLYVAFLINMHMRPFVWDKNPKLKHKEMKELHKVNNKLLEDIILLHLADINSALRNDECKYFHTDEYIEELKNRVTEEEGIK